MRFAGALALSLAAFPSAGKRTQQPDSEPAPAWAYVVPAAGEPLRAAGPTPLALSDELPEDASSRVRFSGRPSFAQLRYGTPDSLRILIALDRRSAGTAGERASGEAALYVDRDRDRALEPEELVPGENGAWEASLAIATGEQDPDGPPLRRVQFRMGGTGTVFSCATLGYLEGKIRLGERELRARRLDGDANGFLTDPRDQLWIDRNDDGQWQSLDELFLYAPTLSIGDERFAPRSDRLGRELALEKLEGSGKIQLALARAGAIAPTALNVLLVGRDGTAVGVRAAGEPIEVPSGEYRLGMVTVWVPDARGGDDWGFVFSDPGGHESVHWYTLEKDRTLTIDPIGELRLQAHSAGALPAARPGSRVTCRPALYTQDWLLINSACRGRPALGATGETAAAVRLLSAEGAVLDSSSTGFA